MERITKEGIKVAHYICNCENQQKASEGYTAWGGGCTHVGRVMHDRSRKTIDARISTVPGRSTLVFHRQTLLAPSAKGSEVLNDSHEGIAASF